MGTTEDGASVSRARYSLTVVVTLLIVVAEFAFLTGVYHLADGLDAQRAAHARATGMLSTLQPEADPESATQAGLAVQALVD